MPRLQPALLSPAAAVPALRCRHCQRHRLVHAGSGGQLDRCAPGAAAAADPYTLVTVDLDDGVRLLGAAVGDIDIDSTVAVELFTLKSDDSGKPLWWYRFRTSEEN